MRSLHLPFPEFSPVSTSEVQALHDMAMGGIKRCVMGRGVRLRTDRVMRKHLYVVYNDSGGRVGDDAVDSYLGVRVVKQAPREWRMSISFLDNNLELSMASSNRRELNTFIWNDTQAFGVRRVCEAIGKVRQAYWVETDIGRVFVAHSGETARQETRTGLTVNDCDSIASRMREVAADLELGTAAA